MVIAKQELRVNPNSNSNVIRAPLNAFERYQLEKQFNSQVPEYKTVGQQKHNVMWGSYGLGAATALGMAIGATKR